MIQKINPQEIPILRFQQLMAGAIAPRPIALVSTIDENGISNLSPFSFFNSFSINPPILVFSPSRRIRDNSTKHTYQNIKIVPEAVINVVNFAMVQQVSLSSTEYKKGVDEFVKSGLTPIPSEMVKPFRVKESPVQFECKILKVIELGNEGGAGNLVIAQIVLMHLDDEILGQNEFIDPDKIDLVGRLGEDYYVRASGEAIFTVKKPLLSLGIGIDSLPEYIRNSKILSGNDLAQLGNLEHFPTLKEIEEVKTWQIKVDHNHETIHQMAKDYIADGKIMDALKLLLHYCP